VTVERGEAGQPGNGAGGEGGTDGGGGGGGGSRTGTGGRGGRGGDVQNGATLVDLLKRPFNRYEWALVKVCLSILPLGAIASIIDLFHS